MQRGQIVLVDTNIIIESVRVNCWTALTMYFKVETVEKCGEEARTGQLHRPGYVTVDEQALRSRLNVHTVTALELAALSLRDPKSDRLDPGERHLWAHALGRSDTWIASSSDGAAVYAAVGLGWSDRLISLEELVHAAGANHAVSKLREQFKGARLSGWRTGALLKKGLP